MRKPFCLMMRHHAIWTREVEDMKPRISSPILLVRISRGYDTRYNIQRKICSLAMPAISPGERQKITYQKREMFTKLCIPRMCISREMRLSSMDCMRETCI